MLPRVAPHLSVPLVLGVLLCLPLRLAFAQVQTPPLNEPQFDAPAYVSVVEGTATLERDGRIENAPLNMPLLSGDRLHTTDGRIEVRFADGGRLLLDTGTSVDVLSDQLVRLLDGRVRVAMVRAAQVNYRIDSPVGSVRILQPGDYRVALLHASSTTGGAGAQETQLELAVTRGGGEIFTDNGTTPVRAGERAYASAGLAPSYAYSYNSANLDDFDRWTDMQRGTVYAASSQSEQYLPADMQTYSSTFDSYGDWRYQQDYGYVWYPRVATEWRPYYNGRWVSYPSYGWTWVAGDRFGWPTHHYGRWGISAGAWFWIPSSTWGPAYVSWGYAPNYVSWCPLGRNNYAVMPISAYSNAGYGSPIGYGGVQHYSAWTVVPRGAFGHGYAYANAVNLHDNRQHFSEGHAPAASRDLAVTRNAAPIRFAGTRTPAVSRTATGPAVASTPASGRIFTGGDTAQAAGRSSQPETPRYINRGDQIVRSQTGRPVPPQRDAAVARSAPQTSPRVAEDAGPRASVPSSQGSSPSSRPSSVPAWRGDAAPRTAPYAGQGQRPPMSAPAPPPNYQQRPTPQDSGQRSMPQESGQRAVPRPDPPQQAPHGYSRPDGSAPHPSGGAERAAPRQEAPPQRSSESAAPRQNGGANRAGGAGTAPRHGGQ